MDSSKTPAPLLFAIAFLIVALGSAAAYRIGLGSGFKYDGILGNIELDAGPNNEKITLSSFVTELEGTLIQAQDRIQEQESVIADLQDKLYFYEEHNADLKQDLKVTKAQLEREANTSVAANTNRNSGRTTFNAAQLSGSTWSANNSTATTRFDSNTSAIAGTTNPPPSNTPSENQTIDQEVENLTANNIPFDREKLQKTKENIEIQIKTTERVISQITKR